MKIVDVPPTNEVAGDDALVLAFCNARPDEMFRLTDVGEIAHSLTSVDAEAVRRSIRRLTDDGMLSRARLNGLVWYGSHDAAEELCRLTRAAVRV